METASITRSPVNHRGVFVPPETDHAIRNDGPELLTYVSATSPPFDQPELGSAFTFEPQPS